MRWHARKLALQDGDVIVVTQKIVSKAEGCWSAGRRSAISRKPSNSPGAAHKDPRLVEVILRESRGVVRQREGVLIMETRHGWVCANAGVDRSNVGGQCGVEVALPLPSGPGRIGAAHPRKA